MEKIITIDGKEVGFRASALTPRLYRHKMGRDIISDLNRLKNAFAKAAAALQLPKPAADAAPEEIEAYGRALQEAQLSVVDLEIFENVAYIMARQYDKAVPDNADDWLEEFETFSIYEILPQILELWGMNQKTTSMPKNA